jgi:hypothetical protein
MKKTGLIFLIMMILALLGFADRADTASLIIPVSEFTPDGNSSPGDYTISMDGILTGSSTYPCFFAPVRIPGKAKKISRVIIYLIDYGTGTVDPYFNLAALNIAEATYEYYISDYVDTGTSTIQGIDLILDQQALLKGRVYQFGTCLDAGQALYGVQVFYKVP